MNDQGEKSKNPRGYGSLTENRQVLAKVIEENWEDLLVGIQIYVRRFGLAEGRPAVEELSFGILQDTVVTALQRAGNYDPSRPARPWLLGVALNKIRRIRRSRGYENRYTTLVADAPQARRMAQQSDSEAPTEEDMLDLLYYSNEQSALCNRPTLDDLLSLVKEDDQVVLGLAFAYGLRGKMLAAELGISEGAAYVRLSRAIKRLRDAYVESEQELGEEK